jgi:hypothetical protein
MQRLRSAHSLATILHALLCGSYLASDSPKALLHALAGCILAIAPVARSTSATAIWLLLIAQDAVLLELSFTYISGVTCLLIAAEGLGLFCSLPEGALRRHNIAQTSKAGKETLAEKGAFYDASKALPCKAYATHSIEKCESRFLPGTPPTVERRERILRDRFRTQAAGGFRCRNRHQVLRRLRKRRAHSDGRMEQGHHPADGSSLSIRGEPCDSNDRLRATKLPASCIGRV